METTLVKVDDIYRLINDNNSIIGTTDLEYQKAFSDVCFLLSTKNCQAINNGYDLDELVKERFGEAFWHDGDKYFKEGFTKALELLGDKKFSEDDIYRALEEGERQDRTGLYDIIRPTEQTEWDVEIELICPHPSDTYVCGMQYGCDGDGCNHPEQIPYLDSDGCLILKRI